MSDFPFHISELSIYKPQKYAEPSVKVPVWVTQSSLDGLATLINFCDGLERGGQGNVPGKFEVLMFYRTVLSCIKEAEFESINTKEEST